MLHNSTGFTHNHRLLLRLSVSVKCFPFDLQKRWEFNVFFSKSSSVCIGSKTFENIMQILILKLRKKRLHLIRCILAIYKVFKN